MKIETQEKMNAQGQIKFIASHKLDVYSNDKNENKDNQK